MFARFLNQIAVIAGTLFLAACSSGGGTPSGGGYSGYGDQAVGKQVVQQLKIQQERESSLASITAAKFSFDPSHALKVTPSSIQAKNGLMKIHFSVYWAPGFLSEFTQFLRDTSDMYWEGEELQSLISTSRYYAKSQKQISFGGCNLMHGDLTYYPQASYEFRRPKDKCPEAVIAITFDRKPVFVSEFTSVPFSLGGGTLNRFGSAERYMWFIEFIDGDGDVLETMCNGINTNSFDSVVGRYDRNRPHLWYLEHFHLRNNYGINQYFLNQEGIRDLIFIQTATVGLPRRLEEVADVRITPRYMQWKDCGDGYYDSDGQFWPTN